MELKKGKLYKIPFLDGCVIVRATSNRYGIVITDNRKRFKYKNGTKIKVSMYSGLTKISKSRAFLEVI